MFLLGFRFEGLRFRFGPNSNGALGLGFEIANWWSCWVVLGLVGGRMLHASHDRVQHSHCN